MLGNVKGAAVLLAASLCACSGGASAIPTQQVGAFSGVRTTASPQLYAFSSLSTASASTTSVASYPLDATGETTPSWSLSGGKTRLQQGHGIAFGNNGRLYVLSGSPGQPLHLLEFGAGERGNARPIVDYRFPSQLLADYTEGLSFDRAGHLWVVDAAGRKVRAFAISGRHLQTVAAFAPELHTTDGWKPAGPHGMFVDSSDHLYCWLVYLKNGIGEIGVTEYDVSHPRQPRILRSFLDPRFPDVPPDSTAMDARGYLYAADSVPEYGVRVYPPTWKSLQPPVRIVGAYKPRSRYVLGSVASLTVRADGTLYVATAGVHGSFSPSIVVYPPHTNGNPQPAATITNAQFLQYADGEDYGNLLAIK